MSASENLGDLSMSELFRAEADSQCAVLTAGLLAVESEPTPARLEELMRAAHSLKGAARIIGLDAAVRVAHAMEDGFVAAQKGRVKLQRPHIDLLLRGVDLLKAIAQMPEAELAKWDGAGKAGIDGFVGALNGLFAGDANRGGDGPSPLQPVTLADRGDEPSPPRQVRAALEGRAPATAPDRFLRVTAAHLNRLLGFAGESLVESRRLGPDVESLRRLKRMQADVARMLDGLRDSIESRAPADSVHAQLITAQRRLDEGRQFLGDRLTDLERLDNRSTSLAARLYHEALACRMRPFADGLHGFARMVRDVAHRLGKEVRLEIIGESTQVDRDMLEKLEAPLTHLLRNAVDHGLEPPAARQAAGKAKAGVLRLEARHSAGLLLISVTDDGHGIDLPRLRESIVAKKLTNAETAATLSEAELLEFLFLPGFTMKESVSEISGRGVGLDVVRSMVREVRGTIRVTTQAGQGTRFQLQLPLSLSVVRTLLVEIGGEPYAFPLAGIRRTLKMPCGDLGSLEGRQHVEHDGRLIGLVTAHQILGLGQPKTTGHEWPVIVLGGAEQAYGVVVDKFLGERELVVQPLDARLGKIKDISAGALMEDGSPVLIIDAEDLLRSIEKIVGTGSLEKLPHERGPAVRRRKRVLVVDDSLTVRELERKLLTSRGYEVELAVDGMDGWNAARTGNFNLIISDVDMPRMDGIELISNIKRDPQLRSIPAMIVSYKEREEDRRRGLEAGADYYLTKGSFHDDRLIEAVVDLIGEAQA